MILILTILLLSFVEYFGDANLKLYARKGRNINLIYGIIFYGFVIKFLIQALKSSNLIYANGMWDGVSTLVETVLAYYLLHESLSNPIQCLGLVMVIAGILALQVGKIPT
jgi:multidrug transporter EmrE-like cation transporter